MIFLLLLLIALPLPLWGEEEVPALLDFDRRNADNYYLQSSIFGGDYVGDKLTHSFLVGGDLQWNPIPPLGIETYFGYSEAGVDRTSALSATMTDRNVFIVSGGLVGTKPAAIRNRKGTVEADFFSTIGGGTVRFNSGNRGMGYFGGGLTTRFEKVPRLGLRTEVRNFLYSIPNPGGSDFEFGVSLSVGLTFYLFAAD